MPPPEAKRPEESTSLHAALVLLATLAAYGNTFGASFHFDDYSAIVENEALRDLGLLWATRGPRVVADLTFWLNFQAGGLAVSGYHAVNVAIHATNALLVLALARSALGSPRLQGAAAGPLLRPWLPLAAGLLFAVHPLATQAVTYVVQRYASLATLLFLAALLLSLQARRALDEGPSAARRALALQGAGLLAALLAMRTKEIAFTLPAVALALDLALFDGPAGRRARLLLPLAAAALAVPLAHLGGHAAPGTGLTAETGTIPRLTYLLTETRAVATYLRLAVWPAGQNLDWDFPLSHSLADPRVLGAAALLLALAAAAVLLLVQAHRTRRAAGTLAGLGIAWFLLTVSVESSVIPIRDVLVEHRAYLPLAGLSLTLAAALLVAVERLRLTAPAPVQVALALLVTAGPLGLAAHARNAVWQDDLTLWTDAVAKSPGKSRPHNHLGIAHLELNDLPAALREFREAVALDPEDPHALLDLGTALRELGYPQEALLQYERAARAGPWLPAARNNYGAMLEAFGRREEALREYREAVRLAPRSAEARENLARLERQVGGGAPPQRRGGP